MTDGRKLGIIAGGGDLPARIAERCRTDGRSFYMLAFIGHTDPDVTTDCDHGWFGLGKVGGALDALHAAGVQDVVMAGGIERPSLRDLDLDKRGGKLLLTLWLKGRGDDALLRVLIGELEAEGFRVVGVSDVLADILMPPGPLGAYAPDEQALADIERGLAVLRLMGAGDVGQAVVVQQGLVLALEAIEGTDAMIARSGPLARSGPGGVLVKIRKPGQEDRADLPTIGPVTITTATAAGLRGLAVEAGGTVAIDRNRLVTVADSAGLFVVGVSLDSPP